MDFPHSVRETYEQFQTRNQMNTKEDKPSSWREIYYAACRQPLDPHLFLFIWSGKSANSEWMFHLLQDWCANRDSEQDKVYLLLSKRKQLKRLPNFPAEYAILSNDANQPKIRRLYGQASYIITAGWLPAFFVRRQGQRVLNLYESSSDNIDRTRLQNADRRLSSFFNSSAICFCDHQQMEQALTSDQLEGFYQGDLLIFPPEEKEQEGMSRLLHYIFHQTETGIEIFENQSSKKHMLLYYRKQKRAPYFEYIQCFTHLIDFKIWDVTFLCQPPDNSEEESTLLSLCPDVRLLYAFGGYNCTVEEYMRQQYLLQDMCYFDDVDAALSSVDASVLASEFQALLGEQTFDEFHYFGDFSQIGLRIALSLPVTIKRKWELDDYQQIRNQCGTPNAKISFSNQLKIYGKLYDQMVFPSGKLREIALKEGEFPDSQLQVFPSTLISPDLLGRNSYETVEFQKSPYAVCELHPQPFHNMYLQLTPCLKEGEQGYLLDAEWTDLHELFQRLAALRMLEESNRWFAAGADVMELQTLAAGYGQQDHVITIDLFMLKSWSGFCSYLQQFSAYLTTNEQDHSLLRIVMELIGKDTQLLTQDHFERIAPLFQNLDSYRAYVKQTFQRFLNMENNLE